MGSHQNFTGTPFPVGESGVRSDRHRTRREGQTGGTGEGNDTESDERDPKGRGGGCRGQTQHRGGEGWDFKTRGTFKDRRRDKRS